MSSAASPRQSPAPRERRPSRSRPEREPAADAQGRRTLGADLERRRLEHRARRLERVLDVLRRRADALGADAPPGLRAALSDFSADLRQVRTDLAPPARGTPVPEGPAMLAHAH